MAFERKSYQEYRKSSAGTGGAQSSTASGSISKFQRKSYSEYLNSEIQTDSNDLSSYRKWMDNALNAITEYNKMADGAMEYNAGKKFSAYQAQNAARFGILSNERNQQRDLVDKMVSQGVISSAQGQEYKNQIKGISAILSNMAKDTSAAQYFSNFKNEDDYYSSEYGYYYSKYANSDDKSNKEKVTDLENLYNFYSSQGDSDKANEVKREITWLYNYGGEETERYGRKQTYEDNQKRLDAIDKELSQIYPTLNSYVGYDPENPDPRQAYYQKRVRELTEERNSLQASNTKYERGQKITDDYYDLTKNADFKEDSAYRSYSNPTKEELSQYDIRRDSSQYYTDANGNTYDAFGTKVTDEYIESLKNNGITDKLGLYLSATEKDKAEAAGTTVTDEGTWASVIKDGIDFSWDELEEGEIEIYYYLMRNQGKEKAEEYLSQMTTELNRRAEVKRAQEIDDASTLGKLAMSIASVPANILGGTVGFIEDVVNTIQGKDINPYSRAHSMSNYASDVREATAKDLNEWTGNGTFLGISLGDVYQALMSGADSAVGAYGLGSKLYGMSMFTGAASSEARDLYEKGASMEQIALGGLFAGAAEGIFEKYSVEQLFDLPDPETKFQIIKNMLMQGATEFSEEMNTEIANALTDAIVMGSQSEFNQRKQQYIAEGKSESEAQALALMDIGMEVWKAGAGGFISGSATGGFYSAANYASNQIAYNNAVKEEGKQILESGTYDSLRALAEEVAGGSKNIFTKEGRLTRQAEKTAKNAMAKNVGKLSVAVDAVRSKQNAADIRTELKNNGTGRMQARSIANIINSYAEGNELTTEQRAKISATPGASEVMDAIGDKNSSVSKRNLKYAMGRLGIKVSEEGTIDAQSLESYLEESIASSKDSNVQIDNLPTGETKSNTEQFASSDDGKTFITETGKEVSIKEVASLEGGKMTLKLDDGSTVSASELTYGSDTEAALYAAVASMNVNGLTANQLIKAYTPDVSVDVYARGISEAYRYGRYGIPVHEMLEKGSFASELTELQRDRAYKLGELFGRNTAETAQNRITAYKKQAKRNTARGQSAISEGKVHIGAGISNISDIQNQSLEGIKMLSKVMGNNWYIYESYVDENGKRVMKDKNGKVVPAPNGIYYSNGDIYIDLNAGASGQGTMLFTAAHEVTHFIKQWSPSKFRVLAEFLNEQYGIKGESVDAMVRRQQEKARRAGKPISYGNAYEEFVADSMETMLTDGAVIEKLAALKQRDATLWEKIKEFFTDLLDKLVGIIDAYDGVSPETAEGKFVAELGKEYKRLQSLFTEALYDASNTYSALTPGENGTVPKTEELIDDVEIEQADRDLESDLYNSGVKYSVRVTDNDTLDFLNSQDTVTTYKTMQLVDGKLYPPMAARISGKHEDYSELGVWEQATEHPELIKNGKFKLDKGKGQGSIEAAYNPYMHSSNLVLNDQFTGAYNRQNLVTVECEVPVSEATSGYHAQYAKDSVGWHPWHTGTVASSLRKARGIERQVFLSRWIMPVRIVPDAEVASMYKDLLDGTDIAVPDNVVTTSLLNELKKVGVPIKESGKVKYSFRGYAEDGKGIYESNFPKGTPKKAKGERILKYIQDVWSKAPITLRIENSDGVRYIEAMFDPKYDEGGNTPTDASKLMGGNRHGSASEQRITLDLADDYYQIASESRYNYSKAEEGKTTAPHENVIQWHYFINDIYFAEYGSDELAPYRVTINVKEKHDGNFVYSFSAEKEEFPSQRTLHAAVNSENDFAAKGKLFNKRIPQTEPEVKNSLRDTEYLSAVEAGDMETAQRMVDEAAKEAGYTIKAYHGTSRADRVGNVFRADRATSGPMAFFTDDRAIAENYSRNKKDTSLAYDTDYDTYETQFRASSKNGAKYTLDMPVHRAWGYIDLRKRNEIKRKAGQLRFDWDGDEDAFILDPNTQEANGDFQWQLKNARGNVITALEEHWLNSGNLFNNEVRFLEVLEMVGVKEELERVGFDLSFKDPNYREEKVYDTYLRITKPFDATKKATEAFIKRFENWIDKQPYGKYDRESQSADMWDKNNVSAESFAERMRDDLERGTSHAWTSIPDSMTDYLKHLHYDGIVDTGGKNGGVVHTVYIPFSSEQVKSADPVTYDDSGNIIPLSERFKHDNDDIRYQNRSEDEPSNRELLVNALIEIAQNDAERKKLEQYKAKVEDINALEKHLAEVNAKIKEISFSKGKRDQAELKKLKEEKIKTGNRLNIYDNQLLRIEASKPLKDILTRERQNFKKAQAERQKAFKKAQSEWNKALKTAQDEGKRTLRNAKAEWREAFKKAQAEGRELAQQARTKEREKSEKLIKEIMQRNKESRENSVDKRRRYQMRNKIKNNVSELRTLLYNGNKKRHVKEGMRDAVEQALMAAQFLFEDGYVSNEDLVKTMPSESINRVKGLTEYRDLVFRKEDIEAEIEETTDVTKRSNLVGELKKVKNKISALNSKLADFFVEERRGRAHAEMDNVIQAMSDAYRGLQKSEYGYIQAAYDENLQASIDNLKTELSGTVIKDMSLSQLSEVHDVFKMIVHTVRTANKVFAADIKETRDQLASNAMDEVIATGKEHGYESDMRRKFNRYVWNNLKPVYAFEKIGSPTLTKLFNNIRKGEDIWAIDVADAKKFRNTIVNRFGYDKWDANDMKEFTSTSGETFKLNLEQRMSIYAYSKREQAIPHLKNGGFVFDNNEMIEVDGKKVRSSSAKAYNLSEETIGKINASLTSDQKNFVDLMQGYLSDVMGAKGNEVSMALYGIEQFKEKYYFPLKSAQQYMPKAKEQSKVPAKTKNYGFTKDVVQKAKNPIILTGFMDTWASHVNEMSMYHAFTLPMEDFYRVYNYTTPNMENMESVSVQATIENAFGNAATNYIDQLLDDLNGGARADGREWMLKGLLGKFKKVAVFASASVVIQQPSAIGRAFALIDHKYFLPNDVTNHNETWAEVKKYAPIAIIKEMGYFDTDMGRSTVDFINSKEYRGAKQKFGAFFKDGDYRDEVLSKAPALADEITWCAIWKAVKRETVATRKDLKINSKEFLEVCGERFTEVITKTQVYDSVLSRSANMRSKSGLMKMVTAFMAEPTTTINMMEDALRKFRNGDKKAGLRIARSVAEATIIKAILVSFVYAMIDDDDDETFLEKYLQSFTSEIIDGFNPLTYLPVIKDVWSIAQGYDVERSDMSIITDAVGAFESLTKAIQNGDGIEDAVWKIADSAGSIFGLPVKNIRRDINSIINTVGTFSSDTKASNGAMWDGIVEAIKNATPVWGWLKDESKTDKLYGAILSGDTSYVERLTADYKDQKAINAAIRTGLKDNDKRVAEAAQALYDGDLETYIRLAKEVIADGFKQDDVVAAINALYDKLKPEEESTYSSESKGLFEMEHFTSAVVRRDMADAEIIKQEIIGTMVTNGKTRDEAEKSFAERVPSPIKNAYLDGLISYNDAVNVLVEHGGIDEEKATSKVGEWDFEMEYGFTWSDRGTAYKNGDISASELKDILMEVGGKTEEDAELQIQVYDWQKEVPGCDDITASAIEDYNEWCEGAGISKYDFYDAWSLYNDTHGDVDENGDSIPYSKTVKVMPYIDSLPLTAEQKTALALCWWGESTVRKYKLW